MPGEPLLLDETAGEALDRALRFIEYRPRSSGETRDRLARWGYGPPTREAVISHLEQCGILDDRDFARVYMGEMLRKKYGYFRVRGELLKKRIDRELLDEIMSEYPSEGELARAVDLAEPLAAKFGVGDRSAARSKIVGFLVRRGYARSVALEASRLAGEFDTQTSPELE